MSHVGVPGTLVSPCASRKVNTYKKLNQSHIASIIDHTLLRPEARECDLVNLCDEARTFQFASVCVNPCWVRLAVRELAGSGVVICTVIGFPLGANETGTKSREAELALEQGATELDVVQNIGALRSGDSAAVRRELGALAELVHAARGRLKVILETCFLNVEEKRVACQLAEEAGADFVKTSTGFGSAGATKEDVQLLRASVSPSIGVKASGGIRTLDAVVAMTEAGANRIGTSSGVAILDELAES